MRKKHPSGVLEGYFWFGKHLIPSSYNLILQSLQRTVRSVRSEVKPSVVPQSRTCTYRQS